MFVSYFEYMTMRIDAVKDRPDFIKKFGKEFMRAFQEEMEFAGFKAIRDSSLDINAELDKIEEKYRFNDDMDVLLSAVVPIVRSAVLTEHCNLLRISKESSDAAAEVMGYAKCRMDQMLCVEIHPTHTPKMDKNMMKLLHELRKIWEINNDNENQRILI